MKLALFACLSLCAQDGANLFESRCAGCHGADGAGGEHAPTIVENSRRRNAPNLRDVIKNGIKEGGMPPFNFSDAEMNDLVAYLSALRAPAIDHPANGSVQAGQAFFLKNCTACHMIKGRGGVLGPDLTNVARERRLLQIEQALQRPKASAVTLLLRDGGTLTGIVKNESNYDLQLQGTDGALHVFSKSEIVEETSKSLMPAVEAAAIPDLLAFLSRLTNESAPFVNIPAPASIEVTFKSGDWPTYH